MTGTEEFQEDPPREDRAGAQAHSADTLLVNLEGFEGPIDILLELARNQKVDITKISILELARQYLEFIDRARELRLDLAADYLVMAAWLAYLKSRLLLPVQEKEDEPSPREMAEALQFQLRRLEAMRSMAQKLMKRPQLGQRVFARGMPENLRVKTDTVYDVSLYEMLHAYGEIQRRREGGGSYDVPSFSIVSMEQAMERLTNMLGALPRKGNMSVWTTLHNLIPEGLADKLLCRSALASTFSAGLELVKQGRLEIRQDGAFKPIYLRAREKLEEKAEDE